MKLIIWDLDGTVWPGTLTEGGDITPIPEVISLIKATEQNGIIHSICSNSDHRAEKHLRELGLWDLFVFPSINKEPKHARVLSIIESCQLRPADVVFIDDNKWNLEQIKYYIPDITILNNFSELSTVDLPVTGKSRTSQYRILERKTVDKNNEDFLQQSNIQIAICSRADCVPYADRIEELVNRSNQLNYTRSRFIKTNVKELLLKSKGESYAVFAWDKYGYYGLIGYFGFTFNPHMLRYLKDFVFSCRIMHMGIENAVAKYINDKFNYVTDLVSLDNNHIQVHEYKDVENFILSNESMTVPIGDRVKILAGCYGTAIHSYSKLKHVLYYERWWEEITFHSNDLLQGQEYNIPDVFVFAAYTEFTFHKKTWTYTDTDYLGKVIDHFIAYVREHNKKCLVILPSQNSLVGADARYSFMFKRYMNGMDNTHIFVVEAPDDDSRIMETDILNDSPLGVHKLSRAQYHWVANTIDGWVSSMVT